MHGVLSSLEVALITHFTSVIVCPESFSFFPSGRNFFHFLLTLLAEITVVRLYSTFRTNKVFAVRVITVY
jgi:hypothetical protein